MCFLKTPCHLHSFIPSTQQQTRMSDMGEEESREYDGTAKETKDDEEGRSDSDEEDRMVSEMVKYFLHLNGFHGMCCRQSACYKAEE